MYTYIFFYMHVYISFPSGNVAYLKQAKLSTPHGDFDASYAVDGVIVTGAGDNAASWNTDPISPAWWMVDLEIYHQIREFHIYNTNSPISRYILDKWDMYITVMAINAILYFHFSDFCNSDIGYVFDAYSSTSTPLNVKYGH